jgi:copper chaperone CopZ
MKINHLLADPEKFIEKITTALNVLFSAVFQNLSSKSASKVVFEDERNSFGGMVNKAFEECKSVEEKVKKLEGMMDIMSDVKKIEVSKTSKNFFDHIVDSFKNPAKLNSEIVQDDPFGMLTSLIKSVMDGSILVALINTFIHDTKLKNLIMSFLKTVVMLTEHVVNNKTGSLTNKITKDIQNQLAELLESMIDLIGEEKKQIKEVFNVIKDFMPKIMNLYYQFQNSEKLEISKIKIKILGLIKSLIENLDHEQKDLLQAIISIILGIDMWEFKDEENVIFDVSFGFR